MDQETKICQNCHNTFVIEPEDFDIYKKFDVPPPTWCPECRFRRKALFRNESTLYSRKCELCGKSIISSYHPSSPYVIYCNPCWYSDEWDAYSYGKPYNPSRSFLDQFGELLIKVPKFATYNSSFAKSVNSEYINYAGGKGGAKNCFLYFNSGEGEDSMYCRGVQFVKNVGDAYYGSYLERCYEIINTKKSAGVSFSQNVDGCLDSSFLYSCSGCSNCFGCVNVRHGKYKFLNEQLSQDEYETRASRIRGSYAATAQFRKEFEKFSLEFPRRASVNLKTVESTGDFILETKNVCDSFEAMGAEDGRYLYFVKRIKDSYDAIGFGYDSELLLETVGVGYTS